MTRPPDTALRTNAALVALADKLARRAVLPDSGGAGRWEDQSLATGAAGTALLHIERAHTGHGSWSNAHAWISAAARGDISAADTTGLYLGVTAVAVILRAAATGQRDRYRTALQTIDGHVRRLAHRRVTSAMERIGRGHPPTFGEYDLFYGLTGIGAYLLRAAPGGSTIERVLRYLVALTRPRTDNGGELPGWWVGHGPRREASAGGHANFGAAHGITGPLLLMSHAMRRGVTIEGQAEAIATICAWLDAWRQECEAGSWWPEWITRDELRSGRPHQSGPARPSWCYGTPGIARAGQVAAIALGDSRRRRSYETALARCLSDPVQMGRVTDAGLCHGAAGVYQTAWRAACDAVTPELTDQLPHLADRLVRRVPSGAGGPSFLTGDAGTALALHTAASNEAPTTGWDACLLID